MRHKRPEVVFGVVLAAVLAALLWNYVLRAAAIPPELRYVPPDASAFAIASSATTLWKAADPHVGKFFRDQGAGQNRNRGEEATPMREAADAIVSLLRDRKLVVRSPEELRGHGIDPERRIVVALVREDLIAVIPLADGGLFRTALRTLLDPPEVSEAVITTGSDEHAVAKFGAVEVAFPEAGIAVVATSEPALISALADPDANLRYFRDNDALQLRLAAITPPRLSSNDAWIKANVRLTSLAGAGLGDMSAIAVVAADSIRVRARAAVNVGEARLLRRAVEEELPAGAAIRTVPDGTNAAIVLRDRHLAYFLAFLDRHGAGPLEETFGALAAQLAQEVARLPSPTEVGLLYLGLRGSIPEIGIVARMDPQDAETMVFQLQRRSQLGRDRRLIERASAQFARGTQETPAPDGSLPQSQQVEQSVASGSSAERAPAPGAGEPPPPRGGAPAGKLVDPKLLVGAGYLMDASPSFWSRYRVTGNKLEDAKFSTADFAGPRYRVREQRYELVYLLPPVGDDDVRYGVAASDREKISESDLRNDRYRLCTTYLDGLLILGTDADTVRALVARRVGATENARIRDAHRDTRVPGAKLTVDVNPRQLADDGLLHPHTEIGANAKRYLSDLQAYRSFFLLAAPDEAKSQVVLELGLAR